MIAAVVALAAVTGGGFAVTGLAQPGPKDSAQRRTGLPPATAPIQQGDLVSSTSVDGTLGYSRESKLNAAAGGTLTWIAGSGSSIGRDERLYAVDGKDVRLMYGTEPMYRVLKSGDKGSDVRQLKANLRALGYGGGLADDETFTPEPPMRSSAGRRSTALRRAVGWGRSRSPSPPVLSGCRARTPPWATAPHPARRS